MKLLNPEFVFIGSIIASVLLSLIGALIFGTPSGRDNEMFLFAIFSGALVGFGFGYLIAHQVKLKSGENE